MMREFNPDPESHLDRLPLHRFEGDMQRARNFFDLYNAYVNYIERQFQISEDSTQALYNNVSRLLPTPDLFERDAASAHQLMRLSLVRVVLPLAEDSFGNHTDFGGWVKDVARTAMNTEHSVHDVEQCVVAPRGMSQFGCRYTSEDGECPVKVVKHELVSGSMMPDLTLPDYEGEWVWDKVRRTLAKLNAAQSLGLVADLEGSTIRNSYLYRIRPLLPDDAENTDI